MRRAGPFDNDVFALHRDQADYRAIPAGTEELIRSELFSIERIDAAMRRGSAVPLPPCAGGAPAGVGGFTMPPAAVPSRMP
jgi:hypothetical protein